MDCRLRRNHARRLHGRRVHFLRRLRQDRAWCGNASGKDEHSVVLHIWWTTRYAPHGLLRGYNRPHAARHPVAVQHCQHHRWFDCTLITLSHAVPGFCDPPLRADAPAQYHRGLDAGSVVEASGSFSAGLIDLEELHRIECDAMPRSGTCSGMFTANTMASIIEALGMAMPGQSSQ